MIKPLVDVGVSTLNRHAVSRILLNVIQQFWRNRGVLNASALTYTTLFAVVPLMTVTYAMLAAVPSFSGVGDQLQSWVFQNFLPETGIKIQDYLLEFSQQARSLTAVGVAALAVTSIMMMKNIEVAFNRIWRIDEPRKGLSSFLLYWAVLSLGPVLVGLGIVLSSYFMSLSIIDSATTLVGKQHLFKLLPVVMSSAAFTLMYMAVPNCRVPLKSAAIGGLVVALLFEAAKRGFGLFVAHFPSYQLIYGAFAAFPLFLLWIFVSWVIILMGCELTRALSVLQNKRQADNEPHFYTLLGVLNCLWQSHKQGDTVDDKTLFKTVPSLTQGRWDDYQQLLLQQKLIRRTESAEYVLAKDLSEVSLHQFYQSLPWPLPVALGLPEQHLWQQQVAEAIVSVEASRKQAFNVSLDGVFCGHLSEDSSNAIEQKEGGSAA